MGTRLFLGGLLTRIHSSGCPSLSLPSVSVSRSVAVTAARHPSLQCRRIAGQSHFLGYNRKIVMGSIASKKGGRRKTTDVAATDNPSPTSAKAGSDSSRQQSANKQDSSWASPLVPGSGGSGGAMDSGGFIEKVVAKASEFGNNE